MNDTTAVPLIVYSATRDPVEALNSLLRRAGVAAHCTWISAPQDIPDALEQINPELLICCPPPGSLLSEITAIRDQVASMVPLIAVRERIDEDVIGADMAQGARDTVSLQQPQRLQSVIARELRAFRLERALTSTLRASQDYRKQLEGVLQRSNDAIAQIQEGILWTPMPPGSNYLASPTPADSSANRSWICSRNRPMRRSRRHSRPACRDAGATTHSGPAP